MKSLIACIIFFSFISPLQQKRKPGNPLEQLPKNIKVLTSFGERADFSPDNKRVAFMAKSFGDAMVIDLKTRMIKCLTCRIPSAAFLRVMHLPNGDYILIGPEKFENINISRSRDNELWYLSKENGSKPQRLNIKMSEGMAISKRSMKIAFAQFSAHTPEVKAGASRLVVADVVVTGNKAEVVNQKTVYESPDANCYIEAQDFFDNDSKMTFSCYEPKGLASVMTIDLQTSKVVNHSRTPGSYNECEGIFPDGKSTLIEADRQCDWLGGERGANNIDIWKLQLDGTGKQLTRITHFNDYEGMKASNPVVSSNGKYMAFQFANSADPAGVGYGILLYSFK